MDKRVVVFGFMLMYIYTLTFNIFMTAVFRIPTPLLFCLPLVFLFPDVVASRSLWYKKELAVIYITAFLLFLVVLEDLPAFFSIIIVATCCALYFNFFVGENIGRLRWSIGLFYSLLFLSGVVMLLDHLFPAPVDAIRELLVGDLITQSPSGIATSIFAFGYQLAALCSFMIIAATTYKKGFLTTAITVITALILIFYGMNRSALVVVAGSAALFWLLYFKLRVTLIFGAFAVLVVAFSSDLQSLEYGRQENILAKTEKKGTEEDRLGLMIENLKIIADYPFGIKVAGRTWNQVARYNPTFRIGESGLVTSHNAYLMFVTYLGIVPAALLFWLLFGKTARIFWLSLTHVKCSEYRLLVALSFSFFAITANAMFHNEWLLQQGGASLFLYFCILHLNKIKFSPGQGN